MVKVKKKKLIIGEAEKKIDHSKNKPYLVLIGVIQLEKTIREIAEKQDGWYTKEQENKFDRLHKSLAGFSKVLNKNFVFNSMELIFNTGLYNNAKSRYKNGENVGFGYNEKIEGIKEIEELYLNIIFFIGICEGLKEFAKDEVLKYYVSLKMQMFSVKNFLEKEYHNKGIGKELFEEKRKKHLEVANG